MTKANHSQCDWGEGHSEGFEAGVVAERERILTMIETYRCVCGACIDCQATDFYMQTIRKGQDD